MSLVLTLLKVTFRKKKNIKYKFSLVIIVIVLFIQMNFYTKTSHSKTNSSSKFYKKILLLNSPNRLEMSSFGTGYEAFERSKCPVASCEITANSTSFWSNLKESKFLILQTFDAIILSYSYIPPEPIIVEYLSSKYQRPPNQRIIFFSQESPITMDLELNKLKNLFNWTMTYRWNSDIPLLYGRVLNKSDETNLQNKNQISRKNKKLVAWMVSHCVTSSLRELYVEELKQFIPVDVFGKCGNLTCPRNETHWISNSECYDKIENEYKFYLAFENSICIDYVTEKFFNILKHDIVLFSMVAQIT